MSDDGSVKIGCSCGGCLSIIFFFVIVWMLIFGFSWNGTHHEMKCSTEHGVTIEDTPTGSPAGSK